MTTDTPHTRLTQFLKAYPSVKYLRLVVTAYSGPQILKTIPIFHALQNAAKANVLVPGTETPPAEGQASPGEDARGVIKGSPGYPASIHKCFIESGGFDFQGVEDGDDCLQIDWTSLKPILSDPESAYAACCLYNDAPKGYGYDADPRIALRRVETRAKREHDLEFLVGHEIEFVIFDGSDLTTPLLDPANGNYSNQFGERGMDITKEIVNSMEYAGVHVWSLHPEDGKHGQFEFQTMPARPVDACDQLDFAIHTIRSVCNKHKCVATIMAAPFGGTTTGRHFHISHNHVELQDYFRSGILHHIPALTAVLIGSVEGWTVRKHFTGGNVIFWAHNKFGPINNKSPGRYEIRPADAQANAHLQVASLLLAGIDGIVRKIEINQKEEVPIKELAQYVVSGDDSAIRQEVNKKYHLDISVPENLAAATEKYEASKDVWVEGLGERVVNGLIQVQKKKWTDRNKYPPDEMKLRLMKAM